MVPKTELSKLPKAPLQEVIFEVRWDLDISPETNQPFDTNFNTALGVLLSNIKKEFPIFKSKFPPGIQLTSDLLNYQTMYQYWSDENKWPVLQLGPGIFTVNETETNYEWSKHYFPLIKKSLTWLKKAYNRDLQFNFVSLRYIDRVSIKEYEFSNWLNFIKENLNFNIENKFNTRGELKKFSFNEIFELHDGSDLQITIGNGKNNKNEDILVWETAIINQSTFDNKKLIQWLEKSHKITHDLFEEICKNELYNSFT